MKSPADLSARLASQWHRPSLRVARLLTAGAWPLVMNIGRPTGKQFSHETSAVQQHVQRWKSVDIGEVVWQPVKYRAGAEAVDIPWQWRINTPSQWIAACQDQSVTDEFQTLERMITHVNVQYQELLIRDRSLWRNKAVDEVLATTRLADSLLPGAAKGRPIRLLAEQGIDTKFIERNATLLTRMLDERFHGEASEQGLYAFLDACEENDHWVLVMPLDEHLLSFQRQRVTTSELAKTILPGQYILVVENEQCRHHLPELPNTIAILGAGLDLQWLKSSVFHDKTIAYWGDMDTWGLLMLARARQYFPAITPLLMGQNTFERFRQHNAVVETTRAGSESPQGLTNAEAAFYQYLLQQPCGRLEQEFLPPDPVHAALYEWQQEQ